MTGSSAAAVRRQYLERIRAGNDNLGLLSPGGPFEQYPGPVLVVARNTVVLTANASGEPIADLLQQGQCVELRGAIDSALAGKAAQVNPFLLGVRGTRDEVGQAFDLVVLPWSEGAAALVLGRDVTLDRSLRGALIESRERYKDLVEASSDFAWETDAEGRFVFVSPHGALGHPAALLIDRRSQDFLVYGEDKATSPFVTRAPVDQVEVWFRDAEGRAACLSAIARPLLGPDGVWRGARGTCREITEQRARDAELARGRHRERLLAYILRMVRDELEPQRMLMAAAGALVPALPALGVVIYDLRPGAEPQPLAQAGTLPPDAPLKAMLNRIAAGEESAETRHEAGHLIVKATRYQRNWNGALCLWRSSEDEAWGEEEEILLEEVAAQVGVANQQLAREAELERLSSTDPLTGLLNRRGFLEHLERRFARASGRSAPAAVFYIDLDNFKPVNDRHGHHAGDKALVGLGEILRDQIRSGDLAARLGGDEFGLFFAGMSVDQARKKGEALLAAAAGLAELSADAALPLGLSVGIAVFDPRDPEDLATLIARADQAMYAAKRAGKGGFELAAPQDGSANR